MSLARTVSTIEELEEFIVERILALDGTPYNQGKKTIGRWKEAEEALVVEGEAYARGHLAFNVFAESGRNTGASRSQDFVRTRSDVVVLFMYKLRAEQHKDARTASLAARDVAAALLALPQNVVQFDVVNSWRPNSIAGGGWLLVRMDFTADFALSLLPAN